MPCVHWFRFNKLIAISSVCVVMILAGCVSKFEDKLYKKNISIQHIQTEAPYSEAWALQLPGYEYGIHSAETKEGAVLGFNTHKSLAAGTDILIYTMSKEGAMHHGRLYGGTHAESLRAIRPRINGGSIVVANSRSLFYTPLKAFRPSASHAKPLFFLLDPEGVPEHVFQIYNPPLTIVDALELSPGQVVFSGYINGKRLLARWEDYADSVELYTGDTGYGGILKKTKTGYVVTGQYVQDERVSITVQNNPLTTQAALRIESPEYDLHVFNILLDESGNMYMIGHCTTSNRKDSFIIKHNRNSIEWARRYRSAGHTLFYDATWEKGRIVISGATADLEKMTPAGFQMSINPDNGESSAFTRLGIPISHTVDVYYNQPGNAWVAGLIKGDGKDAYNVFIAKRSQEQAVKPGQTVLEENVLKLKVHQETVTYTMQTVPASSIPLESVSEPLPSYPNSL
jgi:hypothetical protein